MGRYDHCFIFKDRHGMLKVRRRLSICCPNCPPIRFLHYISCAQVNHGFNGNYQSILQLGSSSSFPIIGNLWSFVQ